MCHLSTMLCSDLIPLKLNFTFSVPLSEPTPFIDIYIVHSNTYYHCSTHSDFSGLFICVEMKEEKKKHILLIQVCFSGGGIGVEGGRVWDSCANKWLIYTVQKSSPNFSSLFLLFSLLSPLSSPFFFFSNELSLDFGLGRGWELRVFLSFSHSFFLTACLPACLFLIYRFLP